MLTPDELTTMQQAARRFQGAYTGTSGTLAGYVIQLLQEVQRLNKALYVTLAERTDAA